MSQDHPGIDTLLEQTHRMYRSGNCEAAIGKAFEVLKLSGKAKYEKGVVRGLIYIADCLSLTSEYEKSIEYIDKLEAHKNYFESRPYDLWLIQKIQLENYRHLGLHQPFVEQYYKAFKTISLEKEPLKRAIGQYNMYLIASRFMSEHPDTAYHYLRLAEGVVESPEFAKDKEEYVRQNKAIVFLYIGDYFFSQKKVDSAQYYYTKADMLIGGLDKCTYKADLLDCKGKIYAYYKEYDRALEYKLKALELYKEQHFTDLVARMYGDLADIYMLKGKDKEGLEYKRLFQLLKDSIENNKIKGRDKNILDIVSKNEARLKKAEDKHLLFTCLIITGALLLLVLLSYIFYSVKKNKDVALQRQQETIRKSSDLLSEKEERIQRLSDQIQMSSEVIGAVKSENEILKQQVNESFDELYALAQENHPRFWARFREVYAGFQEKLLQVSPDLKVSELTLCAYIYLGFSTKEIAASTFKSSKTVENNRSNLRKKLGMSSDEDFTVWMKYIYHTADL